MQTISQIAAVVEAVCYCISVPSEAVCHEIDPALWKIASSDCVKKMFFFIVN